MSSILVFETRADLEAVDNLSRFIGMCRDDITVFSGKMEWDHWLWPKLANFTILGANGRSVDPKDKMQEPFLEFAKAYFRYQQGHNPTGTKNETKALKLLEAVLTKVNGVPNISDLTPEILDLACDLAREHYDSVAYQAGRELERLAKFVSSKHLINGFCAEWVNPIKRKSDNNKIGKAAKELRDKRLPNQQAVMALADIFAQEPEHPKDIFTSSVFALLLCAPSRISEVLALPVDCVHEEMDKEGVSRFGLRFYSGKNYGGNVKWVSTPMIPIAKVAIARLASITEQGRALAKWVLENPHSLYVHENCEKIDIHCPLTRFQTCAILNLNPRSFSEAGTKLFPYKFQNVDSVTYSEILDYAQKRMPQGFPWVNQKAGVRYDNALFSMTANMLHTTRANVPFIPWMPTVNIVNNDLSPRESLGDDSSHKSIFDRFGYKLADGSSMKITTHQLRHLMDTMGQRGGLSEEEIARWAGRADPKQNRTYNHVTEIEQVERLEQYHLESAFNAGQDLKHHEPVTKQEFELLPKGAVHTTIFGFCVHDFVLSPCGKARDCTNCEEHVCVKKDDERRKRVEARRDDLEAQVTAASDGVKEGLYGADRWLEYHELSLSRLDELVRILNDPSVPEGALVKLKNENSFSHLKRALGRQESVMPPHGTSNERAVMDDLLLLMGGEHNG
ncbi:hypothetical protein ALQ34_02299 [Pseudomonas syringae pv. maculicola]|uniref:integrase n=1 Tax=Pseudomonas syringae group genomosp. 3 TaxID=251701 RepID=UPI000EFE1075|nr:integrase [Pseudomonas syringae group genomosp. 3]RMO83528.1 hypothetical protein ALQ34_02299 [Pseudomonas syringae pv. maculicola]